MPPVLSGQAQNRFERLHFELNFLNDWVPLIQSL